LALAGVLRRRRATAAMDGVDARADELRRKLAESRKDCDEEHDDPAHEDPESRRRAVHESARATVEQMRKR
jgi:hypothetical protein